MPGDCLGHSSIFPWASSIDSGSSSGAVTRATSWLWMQQVEKTGLAVPTVFPVNSPAVWPALRRAMNDTEWRRAPPREEQMSAQVCVVCLPLSPTEDGMERGHP